MRGRVWTVAALLTGVAAVSMPATAMGDKKMLHDEIRAAKAATEAYHDVAAAEADGFFRVTEYIPTHSIHYLNPSRVDATFDPAEPEGLLYLPQPDGSLELAGVFYYLPMDLVPDMPEGFTGHMDHWHMHEGLCIYQDDLYVTQGVAEAVCNAGGGMWWEQFGWLTHAWIWLRNPDGVFTEENPKAILPAATLTGHGPAALLDVTAKNCRINVYAEMLWNRGIDHLRIEGHVGGVTVGPFEFPLDLSAKSITVSGVAFPVDPGTPSVNVTFHLHVLDSKGNVVATGEDTAVPSCVL